MIITSSQCMSFTPNSNGGEYKHLLTIDEMPSHSHNITLPVSTNWSGNGGSAYQLNNATTDNITKNYIKTTGNSNSHNNVQPYIVVFFWRRLK